MTDGDQGRWLTISEAAERLGISQKTLRRWADRGMVEHRRTPTGYRLFDLAALEQLIEEMTRDAGAQGKAAA
jgi:excisionase family DNA binding protein